MSRKQYMVFLHPMSGIGIAADRREVYNGVLRFWRGEELTGEFTSYMGWVELQEDNQGKPAAVLQLVPKSDTAAPMPTDQPPPVEGPS